VVEGAYVHGFYLTAFLESQDDAQTEEKTRSMPERLKGKWCSADQPEYSISEKGFGGKKASIKRKK